MKEWKKKGKNDEEGDMEDGDSGGDNYSDCHSDKLGNGIVYAMMIEERGLISSLFCLFFTS